MLILVFNPFLLQLWFILGLGQRLNSSPLPCHNTSHLSTGFTGCEVCQALCAGGMIRTRGVGIMPQKPARKKDPHGDKGKESQARHGFYKLVMVLLPSPPAEDMYCEGNSTNNHVAFAPAVSKCCLRSFKRLLNFSIPHCHRDRKDDFTELFLKEKYLG